MLNRVILMGRITADPEIKNNKDTSVSVTSFSIAVDGDYESRARSVKPTSLIYVGEVQRNFYAVTLEKVLYIAVEGQLQSRQFQG